MVKCKIPFVKTFFRCILGGVLACTVLGTTVFVSTKDVNAKICFLPGRCIGDPAPDNSVTSGGIKAIQGKQCLGYTLTQIKCKNQACEVGWICDSCTNAQGTFYMCAEKITPSGYTKGLYECSKSCQRYSHNGFTGNQLNGQCTQIEGYSTNKPAECTTFQMPEYVYGAEVIGNTINSLKRSNCYYNVAPLAGGTFKREKPASCTFYDTKKDSYNKDCYANAVSIGDHFTTSKRNETAFIVEKKSGTDGVECYRATACNTANGWLNASEVDGTKFAYSELTADGITCRKATACKESNQWFNKDTLGKYTNYFDMASETRSGTTCYKATGCASNAYSSEPDSRYFTSNKFNEAYSNGHKCWIVTGKASYAYNAGDRKTNYFDYSSETKYLNGGNTQVTYYIVNKDNGRNGCMQYAYEDTPDAKYFASNSLAHYSNGSSTKKTCYNITGKGTYAYAENEKKTTHFAYDTGSEGFLNGTSSTVKYFNVTDCGSYAYDEQPDAKYFAYNSDSRKKGGVNSNITCWNITGKGTYAYAENEKKTTHFVYDTGSEGFLNGTSSKVKYFNVTDCGSYAYKSAPAATCYSSNSEVQKKGGVNSDLTCWNITGKGTYAYKTGERILNYFNYDACTSAYLNGTSSQETFYTMKGCMQYAYENEPDGKYFAKAQKSQYLNGLNSNKTCWNITGKGPYAYTESEKLTNYFAYDSGSEGFINGTSLTGKYFNVTDCASGASTTTQDTGIFVVGNNTQNRGGVSSSLKCFRATGCNATNYYANTPHNTGYFVNSKDSASGIDCYKATECASPAIRVANKDTTHFAYDDGATSGTVSCVKANGCSSISDNNRNINYFTYDNGVTSNGHTCYKVTGCATGAVEAGGKNNTYLVYDSGATSGSKTCYKATGCADNAVLVADKDTVHFSYDSGTTQNGVSCVKASGCASNAVKTKNTDYFVYDTGATSNGHTCYKVNGCSSTAVLEGGKNTTYLTYDTGFTSGKRL